MSQPRPRWRPLLGGLIVVATLVFLGLTIARQWRELQQFSWQVDPLQLGASVLALFLVFALGGYVWRRLLHHMGVRVGFLPLLRLWYLSSLARYVPGKVWQFVGAAQLGRRLGLAPVPLLTSMVLQMAFLMVAGAAVALPALLLADLPSGAGMAAILAAAVAAAVVLVHPRVLNTGLDLASRALPEGVLRWEGSWGDGVRLLALYILVWVAQGLAFALFVHSIVELPGAALPVLVGANALAMVAGMLVFVVPAGLGAREAVLALLLSPWAPMGAAALIAVASRLWTIATELFGTAVMVGMPAARPGPEPSGSPEHVHGSTGGEPGA